MILYDLTCPAEHRFESWFRNSGAVDKLIKTGQVACPVCGSKKVQKAPMAPLIGKGRIGNSDIARSHADNAPAAKPSPDVAAALEKAAAAFSELQQVIEKNFEHVGERFPEEARRIHYGESKRRGIFGEATMEDARALQDEGIEVGVLPKQRRTDA